MSRDYAESRPLVAGSSSAIELRPIRSERDDSPRDSLHLHTEPSNAPSAASTSTPQNSHASPSPRPTSSHSPTETAPPLPSNGQAFPVSQGVDVDGKPRQTVPPRPWKETVKLWKGELIAASLAIALTGLQIALFAHYNHEFLFTHHQGLRHTAWWPFDFKPNPAFALANAFVDAALTFCISSCIGQLRWHWYQRKAQSMEWLDIFSNVYIP